VKGRKRISSVRFYEQAKSDSKINDVPIVLMKEDRGPFFVLLQLDDLVEFAELISAARREKV
tara:strand:- start:9809 stop:9994 length:186 start_codon:yes stop_codon:yes gene_type:complete